MEITITVWRIQSRTGLDHARPGEDYPIVNTVHVRYPDVNRVKGQPHDIQEYIDVPCIQYWDDNAINKIHQRGANCNMPDLAKIDEIIADYKKMGDVTVIYNFDRAQYDTLNSEYQITDYGALKHR